MQLYNCPRYTPDGAAFVHQHVCQKKVFSLSIRNIKDVAYQNVVNDVIVE